MSDLLLSVLKDSVILFLLVFFILHIMDILLHNVSKGQIGKHNFFVVNALDLSAGELEKSIRSVLKKYNARLVVVTNKDDPEANAVLDLLCRDFDQIYPILPEDLSSFITSETTKNTVLKPR